MLHKLKTAHSWSQTQREAWSPGGGSPVNDPSNHPDHPSLNHLYRIRGALQGVTLEGLLTASNLQAWGHWASCCIWHGSEKGCCFATKVMPSVSLNPFFFHYNTIGIHIDHNKLQPCEVRPDIHQYNIGNTSLVSVVYVSNHHILWRPLKCVSPPHLTWERQVSNFTSFISLFLHFLLLYTSSFPSTSSTGH